MTPLAIGPTAERGAPRRRLGEMLLAAGLVTPSQLEEALAEQARAGARLGETLVNMGFLSEERLARFLAEQAGLPYLAGGDLTVEPAAARLLPEQVARSYGVLPVRQTRDEVTVAVTDPANIQFLEDLHFAWNRRVQAVVVTPSALGRALDSLYGKAGTAGEQGVAAGWGGQERRREGEKAAGGAAGPSPGKEGDRAGAGGAPAADTGEDGAVAALAEGILVAAARLGASDVHLEPFGDGLHVRCRVDGLLRPLRTLPPDRGAPLVNRFKLLAGMDIAERRQPQDGRFRWREGESQAGGAAAGGEGKGALSPALGRGGAAGGRTLDVRASTLPTVHGEKLVLRLLDPGRVVESLDELGFLPDVLAGYRRALAVTAGIFLVTGPTGSGKTTTLLATMAELRSPEKNLVTIEDPVEYQLAGINQVQVNQKAGLTFAAGLRAILRQDPDVVMVGEIRDRETAEIAIRAALTGHLVLSTLHANDAAGAVTRLLEIGVEPYLVAAAVIGSLAQRLARRLCPACRRPVRLAADAPERSLLRIPASRDGFYEPGGCVGCGGSGYRGRVPLVELLVMDEEMRAAILGGQDAAALRRAARAAGGRDLVADGVEKAALGWTSLAEVRRVALLEV